MIVTNFVFLNLLSLLLYLDFEKYSCRLLYWNHFKFKKEICHFFITILLYFDGFSQIPCICYSKLLFPMSFIKFFDQRDGSFKFMRDCALDHCIGAVDRYDSIFNQEARPHPAW